MAAIIFPHTKWLPKITDYRDTATLKAYNNIMHTHVSHYRLLRTLWYTHTHLWASLALCSPAPPLTTAVLYIVPTMLTEYKVALSYKGLRWYYNCKNFSVGVNLYSGIWKRLYAILEHTSVDRFLSALDQSHTFLVNTKCVCVCVCVCVTMKKSARRMASTTSDTGDASRKQQQAQRKENYNKRKRPVSSVDHCHPYRRKKRREAVY